jgi:hypothetical protein
MKLSAQMFNEIGIAACLVAAATTALILMVGHAVWKAMANTL